MNSKVKEPFVRITKRDALPFWSGWLIRLMGLVLALGVCAIVIYAMVKLNPLKVYGAMLQGAFGSTKRSWITLRDTMMLLCIGVGLAPAFKMRFWNLGAEGQVLVGGIATAAVMLYCGQAMPTWALLLISLAVSCIAGALWGVIPAVFKARFGTNETLFTLMMNYVAIQLTSFFVAKWENPYGSNTVGIINQGTKSGWFPSLFGQQYMLNVILVMAMTIFVYVYLRYSKHGYEISVVGESERTARYIGIDVRRVIIRTMALSGAICGLAGFIAVSGASHSISTSTAGGRGFTAIIVAWLSGFNTFVMILVSLLLVFLEKGAIQIASQYNLNDYASEMITGIILFFILGSEFFINYQLVFHGKKEAK
ncbi:MAG: ABC transporter permease [Clostridia bacterium]|nr:ABC transporter permease [Clostridia bacterium]